jgi:RHH-type proline utilization regulon transcriptional repressor/proline dehydrogenase/delta 1-pyrroline-5-carboxylate dehydrogenase
MSVPPGRLTPIQPSPAESVARLPPPGRDEGQVLDDLLRRLAGGLDWARAAARAGPWVVAVRATPAPFWAMESLLREYPISSAEGLALMRLAEALLRVPDAETAVALTADQLGRAAFDAGSGGPHQLLANLSAQAISLSKRFLPEADADSGLLRRLGAQTVVAATVRAIGLLGRQFVLGRRIGEAMAEAGAARRAQPTLRFSYDMLGEGARTDADALRYLASYRQAVDALAGAGPSGAGPQARDGISIKLSALFARYEDAQRDRVRAELLPRVWSLVEPAALADINLTIDAEESDRLELSLEVFEALAGRVAERCPRWQGLGLAVQAYQTRALAVVDEVARIARRHGLRFMVRLVKGAYWDGEIKRAQELGLAGYPVFTHKHHTDISYLTCAHALLGHAAAGLVYPQFATHNAGTLAALLQMAEAAGADFELQRLHGMGEGVYRELMRGSDVPVRVYAPVGEHRDLLAYLVRRLLENGANSSFVHQLADESVELSELLASPLVPAIAPGLPLPVALFGWDPAQHAAGLPTGRRNASGVDLACARERAPLLAALAQARREVVRETAVVDVDAAVQGLHGGQAAWGERPVAQRAAILRTAADRLEAQLPAFCALLVREAHKTWGDAVSELREAVDFLRYYADEAEARLGEQVLPGPTGERNVLRLHGRGVFVCISPWNFPLAIFIGQVAAALAAGNAVAAKPAEQTPQVAREAVDLLHAAGIPVDALQLLHGPGDTTGAALVAHPLTAGVCFTGSTAVARLINRALAAKDGPIVPLIAETGGLNAMLVDSSALPEQVVDAVVQSAFRSAGQRCSALRLLCVHEGIADAVTEMIRGAMGELRLGDPALLATDVGPLIDAEAHALISGHVTRLRREARLVGETPWPADRTSLPPHLLAPVAFELGSVAELREEVFGPVLHIVRWRGEIDQVLAQVHALGYGLTMGIQTRIDSRAQRLAAAARIGNVYVNRNMIGAVVGVQPFGGEGLSGTGPKAGGPHYLYRFCGEKTVSINTAAAGGNVDLLVPAERLA